MDFADILSISSEAAIREVDFESPVRRSPLMMYDMDFFTTETKGQTCETLAHGGNYTDDEMTGAALLVAFSATSIILTSSVALMMRNNKQLMAHPNSLIFYMCLCEGIIAWQAMVSHLGVPNFVCYFKLDELYANTTPWETPNEDIFSLLRSSNFNILQLFEFISLALNFFLCLDIVLTMRNPFYPHERRMKFYLPLSVIIGISCFGLSLKRINEPAKSEEDEKALTIHSRALFSVMFLSLYIIYAITSLGYVWRINTREGMSSQVRKDFVYRHLLYVCSYIITWLPYLGFAYYILFVSTVEGHDISYKMIGSDDRYKVSLHNWFNAYNLSCIGTGILMSIVRAREPIFKATIYTFVYQFFGEVYSQEGS